MKNQRSLSRRDFLHAGAVAASLTLLGGHAPQSVNALHARADRPVQQFITDSDIRIGTIGHTDHGKTTLTSAITRLQAITGQAIFKPYDMLNNPPERIVYGLPLTIAEVSYRTAGRTYALVDGPRPLDYLGSLDLDGAILVVSAADGPMPQTREHLLQAKQMNVPAVVIFLNKIDLMADPELLQLIELELSELLTSSGYPADVPIIRGSAVFAASSRTLDPYADEMLPIMELVNAIDRHIPAPSRIQVLPFLMPIAEEVFSNAGQVMVAGYMERGMISVGDHVDVVGGSDEVLSAVVTEVVVFQGESDVPHPGDDIGVLLEGIDSGELEPGMVVAQAGSISAYRRFMSDVYILTQEEGGRRRAFFNGYQPQFAIRTADVAGTITLPSGVELAMPGSSVSVEVELGAAAALEQGTRFSVHDGGLVVAFGIVTELLD
jgi:elongation factor Tu